MKSLFRLAKTRSALGVQVKGVEGEVSLVRSTTTSTHPLTFSRDTRWKIGGLIPTAWVPPSGHWERQDWQQLGKLKGKMVRRGERQPTEGNDLLSPYSATRDDYLAMRLGRSGSPGCLVCLFPPILP